MQISVFEAPTRYQRLPIAALPLQQVIKVGEHRIWSDGYRPLRPHCGTRLWVQVSGPTAVKRCRWTGRISSRAKWFLNGVLSSDYWNCVFSVCEGKRYESLHYTGGYRGSLVHWKNTLRGVNARCMITFYEAYVKLLPEQYGIASSANNTLLYARSIQPLHQ